MAGLLGRKFEVPFQENLKFSARHLREPQKTAGLHDVAGLCRELPDRVAELAKLKGARLSK